MKAMVHPRQRYQLNMQVTAKGWWAIEQARRLRLHPDLDPATDWIEVPASWLPTAQGRRRREREGVV